MSLPARLFGVIVSPRETYADVAANPRALGVLLITVLVSAAVTFWFQSTEAGQKAVIAQIDQTLDVVERATGRPAMTDEQYEQAVTAGVSRAPYQSAGTILISTPIVVAILSAILLGVFNGILGGSARYKQVFAAVAHSGVIWTLAAIFGVVMAFAGADLGAASKLAVFVPMLESGFLYHLLAYIDLFWLWGLTSIAIGMSVLYRRQTVSVAVTFIGVYLLCGLAWAAIRSAIGG
jgi:hypothetical protein